VGSGVGNSAGYSIFELIVLQLLFKFVTGQGTDQQPFLMNRGCRGSRGG
jgi:hypothetical protein